MSNKLFTEEEIEKLRENPYVESAAKRSVTFTPEFKEKAYAELKNGTRMKDILLHYGINPDMLGSARIRGMQARIEEQSRRPEGFENLQKEGKKRSETGEKTLEKQLRELRHELAYTRQEVEFLKKIRMADLEAQKQWESKQRRK